MPTPEPIRVAFAIDTMEAGGTELNAVRLAERLNRDRFDIRVVCMRKEGPLAARYEAAGVPVESFPLRSLYGPSAVRQGLRLARYLRTQRIAIVHAHDIYSNVFDVPWARLAGVRTIASRRWWEGFQATPWRLASRLSYRAAHAVLANSTAIGRLLVDAEGVPPARVVVVPNFLDEAAFERPDEATATMLGQELRLDGGAPVVGIVANLLPVKDHAALLRAAAILRPCWPRLRVVLVGDGPCRPALERLAKRTRPGRDDRVCRTPLQRSQPSPAVRYLGALLDQRRVAEQHPRSDGRGAAGRGHEGWRGRRRGDRWRDGNPRAARRPRADGGGDPPVVGRSVPRRTIRPGRSGSRPGALFGGCGPRRPRGFVRATRRSARSVANVSPAHLPAVPEEQPANLQIAFAAQPLPEFLDVPDEGLSREREGIARGERRGGPRRRPGSDDEPPVQRQPERGSAFGRGFRREQIAEPCVGCRFRDGGVKSPPGTDAAVILRPTMAEMMSRLRFHSSRSCAAEQCPILSGCEHEWLPTTCPRWSRSRIEAASTKPRVPM